MPSLQGQYGFNIISAMPTNLCGSGDNLDIHTSHVLPAFMREVHDAKQGGARDAVVWGGGVLRREFLHVGDFALTCPFSYSTSTPSTL